MLPSKFLSRLSDVLRDLRFRDDHAIEMSCRFRPCIDLHEGRVKQIVGGTLRDGEGRPKENFVSGRAPSWFAEKFRKDGLCGGHVIMLGKGNGNEEAARQALGAWPGGMQIGGGITKENASGWLEAGASHVIITSALFDREGKFRLEFLKDLVGEVGKERLVIDLSCKRTVKGWTVAMDRWQTLTDLEVNEETLERLMEFCDEFLIHAADVEGLCGGVDEELVGMLGGWGRIPVTYAGGAADMKDVRKVAELGRGQVDFTVGSALDIFGGRGICYAELAAMSGI